MHISTSRARMGAVLLALLGATVLHAARDAGAVIPPIMPPTGNVLTCSTVQFRAPGTTRPLWFTNQGSVDPLTGLYTAPTTAQGHPTTNVGFTGGFNPVTVGLPLATAFPGTVTTEPLAGNPNGINSSAPYEHALSSNGQRVYAAVTGPNVPNHSSPATVNVLVSSDGGQSFPSMSTVTVGNVNCATVAADPGNSNVAYLVSDASPAGWISVRVAVSTDGGKTFAAAQTYVVADNTNLYNGFASLDCPDVISPSPGHVVAAAVIPAPNGTSNIALWSSGNYGSTLGPSAASLPPSTSNPTNPVNATSGISASNTQTAPPSTAGFLSNNNYDGPRLFTNGNGVVCVGYDTVAPNHGVSSLYLQCSRDSGAMWTPPKLISSPPNVTEHNPLFGAISPSGKVAVTHLSQTGSTSEVMVTIFADASLTSVTRAMMYPTLSRNSVVPGSIPARPVLAWESDNVLWLAQTLNFHNSPVLVVDKLCDPSGPSPTWSGPVSLGGYVGTSLISTAGGMVAGGYLSGVSNVTIPLASNVVH
jgi:hypothetical protein